MSDEIRFPASEHRPPSGRRRFLLRLGGLAALLAVLGLLIWYLTRPRPDMQAVQEMNNRGVGLMERFEYRDAIPVFEDVVRMAPEWLPGRINLGIALLNAGGKDPSALPQSKAVFEEILRKEPDNPHAHFCLGMLLMYQKDSEDAVKHFEAVLKKDPNDAASWLWLAQLKPGGKEKWDCYQRAWELDPHLNASLYQLALHQQQHDPASPLLAQWQALEQAHWLNPSDIKFSQMGHYAEVIGGTGERQSPRTGPPPVFERCDETSVNLPTISSWASVQLKPADAARWATTSDLNRSTHSGEWSISPLFSVFPFGTAPSSCPLLWTCSSLWTYATADALGALRQQVRGSRGAVMVVLDFNRDGKPDLFLAGAVLDKGQIRDLLLRNEGGGRFVDVTAEAGLAAPRPTLGCCVADFDNDGYPDLLLTGAGMQRLFHNTGKGTFEDVTKEAGLADLQTVCLTAAAFDLDQDSDLDLIFCQYAATVEEAVRLLRGQQASNTGRLAVYLHTGEAPAVKEGQIEPPLKLKYARASLPPLQGPPGAAVGVAASDMDGDHDLDFLTLHDNAPPAVVINDRLLKFRRTTLADQRLSSGNWNGALVLDVDHDGRSELLLLPAGQPPRVLHNRAVPGQENVDDWFDTLVLDSPPLQQALAVDLDMDTWTDIVGISQTGQLVFLHNKGGRLVREATAFGQPPGWSQDLIAVAVCDINGDDSPDLIVWSAKNGVQLYVNRGNGNHAVQVWLRGHNMNQGQNRVRCNADGVGVWAVAQVRGLWAGQEHTTLSAGLGQSRPPLLLGLGPNRRADVLRLRWPDGTWQAELNILAGAPISVSQYNRMPGSCPILFAWDGQRFVFVNDFLGAGSIGETGPDGTRRPPRPEESVKIESEQLVTRDGQYVLKITEPMDETTYLDHLQLVVVDSPPGVRVYPDERFVTTGPPPSQELVAFSKEIFPVAARDHRGRDVTETLRHWDRFAVDDFAKRAWTGFAEEHSVELDFGDRLAAFGPRDRLYLCLAGWTEYPFPESSWAAHQAGITERWPILERQDESGQWRSLGEAGFPAGLPRMMLLDVTGKLAGPNCRLRLRTNMHICWDQIFVAADVSQPRTVCLDVHNATLEPGRVVREHSPDGRAPALYDYHRHEDVPLVRQSGRLTRFGDVSELLRQRDDRFVIFGPGDDLTVRFDAALPPLPSGWKRSFVLRTAGYCKDTALSTSHGATVEPLPFQAMRNYPWRADERYPDDPLHLDYLRRFLTREVHANPAPLRRGR